MARSASNHITLAGHTVRSPTSRAPVAHRYHVDAVHADHAAYPTVPPSPPPHANAHPPVEGVKLAGWSGGHLQDRRTCIHRPRLPVPQALDSTVAYLGRSSPKFVSLSAGLAALLAPPRHVHPRTVKSSQLVLALLFGALAPGTAVPCRQWDPDHDYSEGYLQMDFSGASLEVNNLGGYCNDADLNNDCTAIVDGHDTSQPILLYENVGLLRKAAYPGYTPVPGAPLTRVHLKVEVAPGSKKRRNQRQRVFRAKVSKYR